MTVRGRQAARITGEVNVVGLNTGFGEALEQEIEQFKRDRVYKRLNYLDSPQSARARSSFFRRTIISDCVTSRP